MYPAGILTNKLTGRFHPIVFRRAPRPSEWDSAVVRHKSIGHHTDGFDTMEQAVAHINEQKWDDKGARWDWDGVSVPAIVCAF